MSSLFPSPERQGILLYLPWEFDLLGGVDVVVDRLWHGLQQGNDNQALIGIQSWHQSGLHTDQDGRRFVFLNMPDPGEKPWSLRSLVMLLRRMPRIKQQLDALAIGTVNVHYPTQNAFCLTLLKRLGLWRGRIVLSFHGSDILTVDPGRQVWQWIAQQTDAVTACSQALADRVSATRLFDHCKITVVHNGIDSARFSSQANALESAISGPYLLNVGNYVPGKGQNVLIEAFASIASRRPELQLVFVGGTDNGSWLGILRASARKLGIDARVHFLENQPQSSVAALMKSATCLVHSSHNEAFGLVIIEAAASGLPVIATHVGGVPEIITSSAHGCLVEPDNPSLLAKTIESLLSDPKRMTTMAQKLNERVRACFSTEAMVNGYRAVYLAAQLNAPHLATPPAKRAGSA